MEISEYRKQFMEELRFDAEHEGAEPESIFIEKALEQLEEAGDIADPYQISVEIRGSKNRLMAFDAYAYDDADGALVMIASDFYNEIDTVHTLTNSRIDDLYKRMTNFIDECVNGNVSKYCDDSDPAILIAKEIKERIGKTTLDWNIVKFKFIIISNADLSKQVKDISRDNFMDRPVLMNVWTIERFFQSRISTESEIIEFNTADFGCEGIPCLKAELGDKADYDAYLGIVPGRFLAEAYKQYGSKLLQGNVRAFLSVRGKVNRGIRETIIKNPENFFTYNNGIAVVARSVKFSNDGSKIVHLRDPQIINGGQTTASLANAIIKKERNADEMGNLFVPMKLTVLNIEDEMSEEQVEQYNDITKKISQCANSQNAVSDADFFSNHPFHVIMENLSRKTMAPPVNGNPFQTIWYYERSRGKWEQEQMQLSPAKKAEFQQKEPKSQVIKKEKLAKCLNAFAMNPHEVCQSAAINFKKFAETIDDMYDNSRDSINEVYFKKCVCSVIIFDSLDKIINKADWYPTGGNKAQIVPYTISKLMSILPDGTDLDWTTIWKNQSLYKVMKNELESIAKKIHFFLMDEAKGGLVRTMCRRKETWTKCKKLDIHLSDEFIATLISKKETKDIEKAAKRQRRFNSDIDASMEIFNLGVHYWTRVCNDAEKDRIVPVGDITFIQSIIKYLSSYSLPTKAQCRRLLKIVEKMEDKGYIMP